MSRLLAPIALTSLLLSCTPATAPSRPLGRASAATASSAAPRSATAPTPSEDREADVAVEVRAPLRARYDPAVVGATKPGLGVVVTNRGAQALDVSNLRVHLSAAREGVAFRCAKAVGPQPGDREPTSLGPGESYVFDRTLDCALPLVGAYAVRIAVSFGTGSFQAPHEVRTFSLTVTALPSVSPREVDGLPGLWAAMGASNTLGGGADGARGRMLVTLVNSSRLPIEVPPMRVALRVYRVGNPIPCEDQPIAIRTPEVIGAGQAYYEPIEVSCLGLAVPGSYEVVARLLLAPRMERAKENDREVTLGRLRIEVVTDPSLLVAPRWN